MYGDMSRVRTRATTLRTAADEARARAKALQRQAQDMQWKSSAADVLRNRISDASTSYAALASSLDAAADELVKHAAAVDGVKALIAKAEQWVGARLNDARNLAQNVVETTKNVAEGAVNGFMKAIRTVTDGASTLIEVSVCFLAGREVSHEEVSRARTITSTVPSSPASGSKDWLDLESTFHSRGW